MNLYCPLDKKISQRTRVIITRGFYYFSILQHVGFSLMIGGISLKWCGYSTQAVIIRERLIIARVRYLSKYFKQFMKKKCPLDCVETHGLFAIFMGHTMIHKSK